MSLMSCPECREKISRRARMCPHCGLLLRDVPAVKKARRRAKIKKFIRREVEGIILIIAGCAVILLNWNVFLGLILLFFGLVMVAGGLLGLVGFHLTR